MIFQSEFRTEKTLCHSGETLCHSANENRLPDFSGAFHAENLLIKRGQMLQAMVYLQWIQLSGSYAISVKSLHQNNLPKTDSNCLQDVQKIEGLHQNDLLKTLRVSGQKDCTGYFFANPKEAHPAEKICED